MISSRQSILREFDAFSQRVEDYQAHKSKDKCEAAYEGLYKLFERIRHEIKSGKLKGNDFRFCDDILNDSFLNGLIQLRTIATHIVSDTAQKKGFVQLYTTSGVPTEIPCEVSAAAAFNGDLFTYSNVVSYGTNTIKHSDYLIAARDRIKRKLGIELK